MAIVRYPFASNLDEWHLLPYAAHVRWAVRADDLGAADLIVLPGSKHVADDLDWLRAREIDAAVRLAVARGARVVGVCGGAMMAGVRIADPHGVEGGRPTDVEGLGLLPLVTTMRREKHTAAAEVTFGAAPAPWARLAGVTTRGYEIRHGRVVGSATPIAEGTWVHGNVLATTVHGLFEDPGVLHALTGVRPAAVLDATFDLLADAVDEHLDTELLRRLVGLG